jgi:hypothetical protein
VVTWCLVRIVVQTEQGVQEHCYIGETNYQEFVRPVAHTSRKLALAHRITVVTLWCKHG